MISQTHWIIFQVNSGDVEGKKKVKIHFRKLYRPEDTCLTAAEAFAKDLNLVYWSDDFISTDIVNVRGKGGNSIKNNFGSSFSLKTSWGLIAWDSLQ